MLLLPMKPNIYVHVVPCKIKFYILYIHTCCNISYTLRSVLLCIFILGLVFFLNICIFATILLKYAEILPLHDQLNDNLHTRSPQILCIAIYIMDSVTSV